ncbi:MAG TPA: OsmC family protein [Kouleothrix sp.]|mgnify:CR=1 FL=1|uniref:OsmC family protein n=1 Tax=Kouleothrix sp. TaxID=2779161 RepID=UPI002BE4080E|nr:OsmC family protein [Kouleothrix sp.]
MATELTASVTLQGGMHFVGNVASGYQIDMDASRMAGPLPMETLLLSLAGCTAMDVVAILRKQRQLVENLDVHVRGFRRDEHPAVFTSIQLEYVVHGLDVEPAAVEHAIALSRERYCPIWAMLGASVPITSVFRVVSGELAFVPMD